MKRTALVSVEAATMKQKEVIFTALLLSLNKIGLVPKPKIPEKSKLRI